MKIFNKLPTIAWVFILPIGLIVFIGGIILSFNLMARVEGVVSIIFLIIGFLFVRGSSSMASPSMEKDKAGGRIAAAIGIAFFALMGMAVDQPGNFIYNKPIEWAYCKEDSKLYRGVNVTHPLPERTDITQYYTCIDDNGDQKYEVNLLGVLGIRFIEYVIIAYLLIGIEKLLRMLRSGKKAESGLPAD